MTDIAPVAPSPIPRTFREYVSSFGTGIIVVRTWQAAGGVVGMGVADAYYGYSPMWVLLTAIVMRFPFVSLIARYHPCNQYREGVLVASFPAACSTSSRFASGAKPTRANCVVFFAFLP